MNYRKLGRLQWEVSEVGYGMWGIAGGPGGWRGADYDSAMDCLQAAVNLGCNFFDTAWIYGRGLSEQMLGRLIAANHGEKIYAVTKIPPKDRQWPPRKGSALDEVFPSDHILEYTYRSLENLRVDAIDLLLLHVWEDQWADDEQWQKTAANLKREGVINGFGLSVNRWEPWNCLKAIDTGLIDAIEVIYNIFDQAPEDDLFAKCAQMDIGIIARVPFDEGTLTGNLTRESKWPQGDWRNMYFCEENLLPSVERADRLKRIIPADLTLPETSLRFILSNPVVGSVIPGMRKLKHVRANMTLGAGTDFPPHLRNELKSHRWDRTPTAWSS